MAGVVMRYFTWPPLFIGGGMKIITTVLCGHSTICSRPEAPLLNLDSRNDHRGAVSGAG
jgi:hypothetical protein